MNKIAANITKEEIVEVSKLKGKLNEDGMFFVGFRGAGDSNNGWSGYYCFREANKTDEDMGSMRTSDLPGIENKEE